MAISDSREANPQPDTRKPWIAPRINEIPMREVGSASPLPPS